jgi:hypothetical protein
MIIAFEMISWLGVWEVFFIVNCCVLEWRNLKIIFWTNNSVSSYTSQSICSSVKTPNLRYRRIKARRQLALTIGGVGKKETIERICTRSCLHLGGSTIVQVSSHNASARLLPLHQHVPDVAEVLGQDQRLNLVLG